MAEEVKNPASSPVEEGSSKTDKKKNKKEKKRKHRDLDDASASNVEEKVDISSSKKDKKQKKKEKPKVEAKEEESDDGSNSEDMKLDTEDTLLGDDDKDVRRKARKEERMERKREKEELLKKVPKVDQDGIAYTKLQIKRMLKRVKQGLSPVPTAEEERQKLRNEAQLRREEEAELAGMIFRPEDDGDDNDEGDDDDKPTGEDENDALDDDDSEQDEDDLPAGSGSNHDDQEKFSKEVQQPPKKKSKRSKLVPSDYVCQACKNKHSPAHWIYDCPAKVTVKGTNNKKKKERGLNQPDSRKVFVSGLPFEVKPADVQQLFQGCGKVASCKLVKFGDTGRCNGQAYVTFESDEAATKSLKLSGTMIDNTKEESSKKKSKKSDASPSKRSELKLKISRVLNRRQTKKN